MSISCIVQPVEHKTISMNEINDNAINQFLGEYERPARYISHKNDIFRRRTTMGIHKDCFAYHFGRCAIMTETICRWDSCSFYKTVEQERLDREKYGFDKHYQPKEGRKN